MDDLITHSTEISKDSLESLAEILSLDIIDPELMKNLGEFLYGISKKKKQNLELINNFCQHKCDTVLDKLNAKLESVNVQFALVKKLPRLSPSKTSSLMEIGYSPS